MIEEGRQVTVFLTAIGGPAYELLQNLVLPDAPKGQVSGTVQFKRALRSHLKPKLLTIVHKRTQ